MKITKKFKDVARVLLGKPVKNVAYERKEIFEKMMLPIWFDLEKGAMRLSLELLVNNGRSIFEDGSTKSRTAIWLLVNFLHPFGGVFTVLRIADALERNGWHNRIVIYDNAAFDISPQLELIKRYFPALSRENFSALKGSLNDLPPADIGIATFWPSAYHLTNMSNVAKKAYLIQDFEPAFYPAGTAYALAENTYRLPLHRIYNTQGLMQYIEGNYTLAGSKSTFFTPSADARYQFAPKPLKDPLRFLFYARANTPRNAYELSVVFANALKAKYGEHVQLVAAGENLHPEKNEEVFEHVGLIPYDELPKFYASFHFIVSFMLTKHPSYLPFEAMATGCGVLTNINEANNWFFKDGENCILSMPTVSCLLDAVERAMQKDTYERIIKGGRETVEQTNWDAEMSKVLEFINAL